MGSSFIIGRHPKPYMARVRQTRRPKCLSPNYWSLRESGGVDAYLDFGLKGVLQYSPGSLLYWDTINPCN